MTAKETKAWFGSGGYSCVFQESIQRTDIFSPNICGVQDDSVSGFQADRLRFHLTNIDVDAGTRDVLGERLEVSIGGAALKRQRKIAVKVVGENAGHA